MHKVAHQAMSMEAPDAVHTYTPMPAPSHACCSPCLQAHMTTFAVQADKTEHILAVRPRLIMRPDWQGPDAALSLTHAVPANEAGTYSMSPTVEDQAKVLAAMQAVPRSQAPKVRLLLAPRSSAHMLSLAAADYMQQLQPDSMHQSHPSLQLSSWFRFRAAFASCITASHHGLQSTVANNANVHVCPCVPKLQLSAVWLQAAPGSPSQDSGIVQGLWH